MGRELRRVPMDFQWPAKSVWHGYLIGIIQTCFSETEVNHCDACKAAGKIKGVEFTDYGCPDWDAYLSEPIDMLKKLLEPPKGEGYQLWETTSEGSPISPVFESLESLCEWCEKYATVFAEIKVSKEKWKQLLTEHNGWVAYEDVGIIII